MASNLQPSASRFVSSKEVVSPQMGQLHSFRELAGPGIRMRKDFIIRGSAVILAVLTVFSVVFAIINFQKDGQFSAPDDGVWWVEHNGGLFAKRVVAGGPGDKAGIKEGDQLIAVSDELNSKPADKLLPRNSKEQPKLKPFSTVAQLERRLYAVGVWSKADYVLDRDGSRMGASVILAPTDRS